MSKFILISVCDREILTEVFDSYSDALAQRNKEMIEWANVPEEAFADDEYEEIGDNDSFGFTRYEAYANDRCDLDWLIVEIPMEVNNAENH